MMERVFSRLRVEEDEELRRRDGLYTLFMYLGFLEVGMGLKVGCCLRRVSQTSSTARHLPILPRQLQQGGVLEPAPSIMVRRSVLSSIRGVIVGTSWGRQTCP